MGGQGNRRACTACGAEVAAGARFCRSCGVEIVDEVDQPEPTAPAMSVGRQEAACVSCGADIVPTARFCRACGADQQAREPAVADAPTAPLPRAPEPPRPDATLPTATTDLAQREGGRARFVAAMTAVVLAFGAIGGGAAYLLLLAPENDDPSSAPAALVDDPPVDAEATPSDSSVESADDDSASSEEPEKGVLPDVPNLEMEQDIAALLVDFHEAVVDGRFDEAWGYLSKRKQEQIAREDGFAAWRKAQSSLSPHLEPWGLDVTVDSVDRSNAVVQVRVSGMRWTKPGATCAEWSGLTWVLYEQDAWRYDPGYSTTSERERTWKPRYGELLGASC